MTSYLLAGGGTAGHVNPMLAIADEIRRREPDASIVMIGTKEGLEAKLVPARGYDLHTIAKLPFPRRPNKRAMTFISGWNRAVRDVQAVIADRHVDVVVGVGGYAAAPAYLAAKRSAVPIVVHEANAKPGLANRFAARWTPFVGVAFKGTRLRHSRFVGMPLRPEISELDTRLARPMARAAFGFALDEPVVLVTGGSLGSRHMNEALGRALPALLRAGIQVLHITGESASAVSDAREQGYVRLSYCNDMESALSAADLVVARAGSSTVSELAALGLPAVFVPYAVGNGEQSLNARSSADAGGSIVVSNEEFTGEWIERNVIPLISSSVKLETMSQAMASTGTRAGSELTVNLIMEALASRVTSAS
jgi:UDP-N-acetylglucosamine--N-acetylmuramyl-(pentapeptide) pyrophosphoryl-undecaprenol N-acetylglucosamine transferase